MRYKIYTYIHLVVLVLYILRPAMPYIEYAINKDFIAKNLCINRNIPYSCCNGKCYLEKQIKKSLETNDSKGNEPNKKVQNEEANEFLGTQITTPKLFETELTIQVYPETPFTEKYVPAILVPPKIELIA
jgi:hypothetical protein